MTGRIPSDDDETLVPGARDDGDETGLAAAAPPERVGSCVIERELGRGGMGVVWLARDERLDRPVAIKSLPPHVARDPALLAQLEREARALASVNDPNVATIHGIEEAAGTRWLVLELVEGRNLAEILREGALPLPRAMGLALQVASGLSALHARGLVHCDLKPANVRLTPAGNVKIVDFGLARRGPATTGGQAEAAHGARRLSGTPGYMSPEQARGESLDARTDAWAFGCLLFEMLAGRPAISGGSVAERVDATLSGTIDWAALPDVPGALRELLQECLEPDARLRLDDLARAREVLLALASPSGSGGRAAAARQPETNLPAGLSGFVGREREIAALSALIDSGKRAGLITITGEGGCGKTRLAVETASRRLARLSGGAWIAELTLVRDGARVPATVGAAIGLRDRPGADPLRAVAAWFEPRQALLILDTCEHLLDACAALARGLLDACPGLTILATSREPLGLPGEQVFRVPSLPVPSPSATSPREIEASEAVRLFVERARLVRPGFACGADNAAAIAQACRRLDGIPLALELAAARMSVLSPEQLVARLDDRFRVLAGGSKAAIPRQQAMRATLDWSHDLLTEEERRLFRRLSIFAGTFTLEAIERIAAFEPLDPLDALDLTARLVDKSLVSVADRSGHARYRLTETIRQYARERLDDAEEAGRLEDEYRRYYVALAETGRATAHSPAHAPWLDRLSIEHDNLRAVIEGCASDPATVQDGYRLAASLRWLWQGRGYWTEGRQILATLLAADTSGAVTSGRSGALNAAGVLARHQADFEAAEPLLEEGLAGFRSLGDDAGAAACLDNIAGLAYMRGQPAKARARGEEALALRMRLGDRGGMAGVLQTIGVAAIDEGDFATARQRLEACLAIRRELDDVRGIAMALANLATVEHESGDRAAAIPLITEAMDCFRKLGDRASVALLLNNLGKAYSWHGDLDAAIVMLDESAAISRELGDRRGTSYALGNKGAALIARGDLAAARPVLREALKLRRELGTRAMAEMVELVAALAMAAGRPEEGSRLLGAMEALRAQPGAAASPTDLADVAPHAGAALLALGAESFEAAKSAGRALTQEEVSSLMMSVLGGWP